MARHGRARQSQAGLVVATCRGDSPLTLTTRASATLEAPWILPRQGSLGALVAMVPAEFGSNEREANRRWAGEGDTGVAKTEAREMERRAGGGGVLGVIATLKSILCF